MNHFVPMHTGKPRKVRRIVTTAFLDTAVTHTDNRIEYVPAMTGKRVEVIKNPTRQETRQMEAEAKDAQRNTRIAALDEHIRYMKDAEGNVFAWKALEATHSQIEGSIAHAFGFPLPE